jgi:hypothetical protein
MAIIKFIIDDTPGAAPEVKAAIPGDVGPDVLQLQPGDRLLFSVKSGKHVFVDLGTELVALVKHKCPPHFTVVPLADGNMNISLTPPTGAGPPELDPP